MYLLYKFVDRSDVRKTIKELSVIQDAIGKIAHEKGIHRSFDQTITRVNLFDSHQVIANSRRELVDEPDDSLNEDRKMKPHEKQACLKVIYNTFKYIYLCPILFATSWIVIYLEHSNMKSDQSDFR